MAPPRFLFLTVDLPRSRGSGGQIVSWRLLESYARRGPVDVLALAPPNIPPSRGLQDLAHRLAVVTVPHFRSFNAPARVGFTFLRAMLQREPFRIAKFRSTAAARTVEDWASDATYSVVHCDHLSTAPYHRLVANAPAVLGQHDVEWIQFSQIAARHSNPVVRRLLASDSRRTRRWEADVLDEFAHILALSDEDRSLMLTERPDLASRMSVWPIPITVAPLELPQSPPTFLTLGALTSLGRREGLRWLVSDVWPKVRAVVPDARLEVVGRGPPRDLQALNGSDGISVRGFVEELEPILARTHACVIPLFVGSGIRVTVLEMIGLGIPCIGTPVALRGLPPLDGCTEASEPEAFAASMRRVVTEAQFVRDAAERGADRLARTHSPERADSSLGRALEMADVSNATR